MLLYVLYRFVYILYMFLHVVYIYIYVCVYTFYICFYTFYIGCCPPKVGFRMEIQQQQQQTSKARGNLDLVPVPGKA